MMGERAAGDDRAERRAQAFCRRQNLGAGGIHFRRAYQIPKGGAASGRRDPKQKDIRKDVLLF